MMGGERKGKRKKNTNTKKPLGNRVENAVGTSSQNIRKYLSMLYGIEESQMCVSVHLLASLYSRAKYRDV
jgi:hypothetical protein